MHREVEAYFEETIIPPVVQKYPEVASEMSIQTRGSYGLGISDEFSDLDAVIYLDDPLWKSHGGQLQLMLEHPPRKFAKTVGHPEICVWPLSWLGHRKEFLEDKEDLPWEKVTVEDLFELQENLILRDPHGIFSRLKSATTPERFPGWLWKKRLIVKLKKLIYNDLSELDSSAKRGQALEASIILGGVLEDLMHIGFIINRKYYPWRKHLRWAFERMPVASKVLPDVEVAIFSPDWDKRLQSINAIIDIYIEQIGANNMLPEVDIFATDVSHELIWAERCEAWSNPTWRRRITQCEERAKEAGYDSNDGWIWSLWGWA